MDIEKYLAEICFCRLCGQGLRDNFEFDTECIGCNEPNDWAILCKRCSHIFIVTKEMLDAHA